MKPMSELAINLWFQKLRWCTAGNALRVLRERSLLRVLTILFCSLVVWGTVFALSYIGFREMRLKWALNLNGLLMGFLLDGLFTSLTFLLVFSTGIIAYSSLFASPEATYLLSTPLPADQIFGYKLQGAIAFSSWAVVLLGSPILIAYGLNVENGAPWFYYPGLLLFFLGFVLIPGALGAIITLLLVNIMPRDRRQLFMLATLFLLLPPLVISWRWVSDVRGLPFGSRVWFSTLLSELDFMKRLPSHWMAQGVQSMVLDEAGQAGYYLALVWSNGLLLYLLAVWLARRLYRPCYNRMASGGRLRKKYGGHWLDLGVDRALFFLDGPIRHLIVKDFRTFRRDPAQWFQMVILVLLAVFSFSSMRRFFVKDIDFAFQNGIGLLTLVAISFLMCAYTGRFIFPMLSLEGRKFWILSLLPLKRDHLLWGKFAFSTVGVIIPAECLVIFCNSMLRIPWQVVLVHCATVAVLACTCSGLSVGLGACMPNFRENDPSKIAVGLGGTLNLIACLLILVVVICAMALPWHLHMIKDPGLTEPLPLWIYHAMAAGVIFGLLTTHLALRSGARALRNMEF